VSFQFLQICGRKASGGGSFAGDGCPTFVISQYDSVFQIFIGINLEGSGKNVGRVSHFGGSPYGFKYRGGVELRQSTTVDRGHGEVGQSTRVEVRQWTHGVVAEQPTNVGLGREEEGQPKNVALDLALGQPKNVALGSLSPVATISDLSHWKPGEKDHGRTVKVKEVPIKLWNDRIEKAL